MSAQPETYPTPEHGWTCFHCGEHFAGDASGQYHARQHFGRTPDDTPVCKMRVPGEYHLLRALRAAEEQLRGYRAEDSDMHRAMSAMQADHATALRREEELGYARGVRDRTAEFKNFHRLLCERFGYGHDNLDWQRDQLSLIEHIASLLPQNHDDAT